MSAAPKQSTAAIGQVIAERYHILRRIGTGGMGAVFEALDLTKRQRVAVKLLRGELRGSRAAMLRFQREGEILEGIDHPNVVSVLATGELPDHTLFLVMELIEGETLRERMERGPMTPWELLPLVRDIVDGLSALHAQGIVHRDLKPNNVLLARSPELRHRGATVVREGAKLVDFGVARAYWRPRLTGEGQVVGTLRCMAPEQVRAERDFDHRVDIYALGVLLYEALHGMHPFRGPASQIVEHVLTGNFAQPDTGWPAIDHVILRAMSARREERHASAQELAAAFADAAFAAGASRPLPRSSRPTRVPGPVSSDERATKPAHYHASTVSHRARRRVVLDTPPPAESGTRRASRTLGQALPTPAPEVTKHGSADARDRNGEHTELGMGHRAPRPNPPPPFEVIPTISYGGMPLPLPAPTPIDSPKPRASTQSRPVRRGSTSLVIMVFALVLGMLAGSFAMAGYLHAQNQTVQSQAEK